MNPPLRLNLAATIGVFAALTVSLSAAPTGLPVNDAALRRFLTHSDKGELDAHHCLDGVEKLVAAAHEELNRQGANPADITDRMSAIGTSTEELFAFVRDKIQTQPYRGKLRGASGALVAESGNSVDKSLLLAALLRASNRECRLMRGTLPDTAAQKVVEQFLNRDPLVGVLQPYLENHDTAETIERIAAKCGFDAEGLKMKLAGNREQSAKALASIATTTSAETDFISAQLDRAKIRLGRSSQSWRQQLTSAVANHVWIQVKVSDDPEKWLDLDPSVPDAKPGQTYATDGSVVEETEIEVHTLQLTLVYKRTVNGSAEETTLLDVNVPCADGLLAHSLFSITPSDPLPSLRQISGQSTGEFIESLKAVKHFRAVFRSGGSTSVSEPFDLTGVIGDPHPASASGMGSFTGGFGFGGGGEPEKQETSFTALYVTLTIHSPGVERPAQRRMLLTAQDLKRSCNPAPLIDWEILLQPSVLPQSVASYGSLHHTVTAVEPTIAVLRKPSLAIEDLEELTHPAQDIYAALPATLAQLRQTALAQSLKTHRDVTALFDTPQIVIAETRGCLCPDAESCGRTRIDIVENGISFVPKNPKADETAAALALRQGVFDTVAEVEVLGAATNAKTLSTPIHTFEAARIRGDSLKIFTHDATTLPFSDADREWINACESDGRLILVADTPPVPGETAAWWSLDPATGVILGRMSGGAGGTEENAIIQDKVAFGGLKCWASAAGKFASSGIKNRQLSEKDAADFGFATLGCVVKLNVGYLKPLLSNNANEVIDYALPWVLGAVTDAIRGPGPKK